MALTDVGELNADWMIELLGIPVSATRRKCALLNFKGCARCGHRRQRLASVSKNCLSIHNRKDEDGADTHTVRLSRRR